MDMFSLKDKVVVVTGGTGVLGDAFVKGIAQAGARVVILGRREEVARQRTNELVDQGYEAIYVIADVLNDDQLIAARDIVLEKWGRIDGLVNAAGGNVREAVVMPEENIFDMKIDHLKKAFDLNLYGTIAPTIIFGEKMVEAGGSIVNISSMTAQQAVTRVLGYSIAKAAVDSFTRWMATELAIRYNGRVRVNAIAPGFFISEQNRRLLTNEDGSLTDRGNKVIRNTPYGRFGSAEELSGCIVWLLSDAASFVTGDIINIDGGFSSYSGV